MGYIAQGAIARPRRGGFGLQASKSRFTARKPSRGITILRPAAPKQAVYGGPPKVVRKPRPVPPLRGPRIGVGAPKGRVRPGISVLSPAKPKPPTIIAEIPTEQQEPAEVAPIIEPGGGGGGGAAWSGGGGGAAWWADKPAEVAPLDEEAGDMVVTKPAPPKSKAGPLVLLAGAAAVAAYFFWS
jgi:hypothetical protein